VSVVNPCVFNMYAIIFLEREAFSKQVVDDAPVEVGRGPGFTGVESQAEDLLVRRPPGGYFSETEGG